MTTALLLLPLSCSIKIHDEKFCSPIPGNLGATCDNFLSSNQEILTEDQWIARQQLWINAGQAVECTSSSTLGDIKAEIEKACSKVKCDYQAQAAIDGINKIIKMGVKK